MARISRVLSAFAATVVMGTGTLAMTPAATAATTSKIPSVGVARHAAIRGAWEGRYTCAQGITGLDLRISRRRVGDSLRATFSFYPLSSNPSVPVGIYTMRGTYYSASRIVLRGLRWVIHPAGYVMVGLSGRLSQGKFQGTVHGPLCTTFSVSKPMGHPSRSNVIGTWKGSYLGCTQGPTGLRLVVKDKGRTGNELRATFNFHPLPSNPTVPSGSYAMTGYYFPGGVVLNGIRWIHMPPGYAMVNLVGAAPRSGQNTFDGAIVGCRTFSLKRS
jgi:hypothetical protein